MKIELSNEKYLRMRIHVFDLLLGEEPDVLLFEFDGVGVYKTVKEFQKIYNEYEKLGKNLFELPFTDRQKYAEYESNANNILGSELPRIEAYKFLGLLTKKEFNLSLPIQYIYVLNSCPMLCIGNRMKVELENIHVSGIKFFPLWNNIDDISNSPKNWLMMAINEIDPTSIFEYSLQENLSKFEYSQVLTENYQNNLEDFNICPFFKRDELQKNEKTQTKLSHLPNIISQKVYQFMKNFEGISFYPINTVSRRLDLEDNIEIIK